ncbi:iron-sulfur cluster assembly accessory protein [Peribacillus sp. FSL H8-0477]|uniref:HesB/IscA family protein n=1 Tax=Peribacillus sp. FSL H8-0477 TaxID=2921388 RepID=UPI0030F50AAB
MIKITDRAKEKIREIQENDEENRFLRFGVRSECCNEMHYSLSLTREKSDQEEILLINEIQVLIHTVDTRYINQTEIDYQENGFWINNPNPLVSPLK